MHRARLLAGLVSALILSSVLVTPAAAQQYPSRVVKLIVPQTPGGATDVFARKIGQLLGEAGASRSSMENRAGAGGVVGTDVGREIRAGRLHAARHLCGLAGDQSEPLSEDSVRQR